MRFNLSILLVTILCAGCTGPTGVPGKDAAGVDVTPPTIALIAPHPLSVVWDGFEIKAAAVDNVAISEVIFMIDGASIFHGQFLKVDSPPYEFEIKFIDNEKIRYLTAGWHFIAARAFDTAGNIADTPLIPILTAYADDLQDTVKYSYHNNLFHESWMIPDEDGANAYWTRFNTPAKSDLISVELALGGNISDSTLCFLQIYKGALYPEEILFSDTLTNEDIGGNPSWRSFNLTENEIEVNGDFFVLVNLPNPTLEDSLILVSDDGEPSWRRGGSRDDTGMFTLLEKYGTEFNFLMNCYLYYAPPDPPDSSGR